MATAKKPKIEYELYFLTVNSFSASVHAGLNYKAVEAANKFDDQIPVFENYPTLVFDCECFYPEKYFGLPFHVTVYGEDYKNNLMLSDCTVKDENGHPTLNKRRGQFYPVHQIPDGIGSLEKVRGQNAWRANCFIDRKAVTQMITVLSLNKEYYLSIDESKVNRYRAVRALDLQTDRPE